MALETSEIPRAEWRTYFDRYSRELGAANVRIEVAGREQGAQVEAELGALGGVSYDDRDDVLSVSLQAPDGGDVERLVSGPQRIYVGRDESTTVIDVEDAEGTKTLVTIEPAPPLPTAE